MTVAVWLGTPEAERHFDPQRLSEADSRRYSVLRGNRSRQEFAVSRALRAEALRGRQEPSSLSHSGGWAAVAYAPADCRIGVDIEWTRARNLLALAKFAYDPAEIQLLESLAGAEREQVFYALWTLKESMAKALGVPLLSATRQCVFSLRDGEWFGSAPINEPWIALSFQPRPEMALAVVVIGPRPLATIATVEWPPQQAAAWLPVARIVGNAPR